MYQTPFADRIRQEAGIATIAVGAISEADHVNCDHRRRPRRPVRRGPPAPGQPGLDADRGRLSLLGRQPAPLHRLRRGRCPGLATLALEVAHKGITVNAVCPGYTETDLLEASIGNIVAQTGRSAEEARSMLARHNPQGRLVQPAEVADAVAWLCSPAAGAINGQSVSVSGGEVM
jgi:hypothetical protein